MNKVIIGLILAVCVLGMALLMLNERLGRKPETQASAPAPQIVTEKEIGLEPLPSGAMAENREQASGENDQSAMSNAEMAQTALEFERQEAREALAPPRDIDIPQREEPGGNEQAAIPPAPPSREARAPEPAKPAPKPVVEKPAPPKESKPRAEAPKKPETSKPETSQERSRETAKPAAEPAKPKTEAAGDNSITRFVVFARDKGATIRISGNRAMRYKSMNLDNPERIVIDFDGDWKFPPRLEVPRNDLVSAVRVGKMGDKTRLVIDLKEKPRLSRFVNTKSGDGVDVRVDK